MISTLEVFAPMATRWIFSTDPLEKEMSINALRELEELSNELTYQTWDNKEYEIEIEIFADPAQFKRFEEKWENPIIPMPHKFVRIKSRIEYAKEDLKNYFTTQDYTLSEEDVRKLYCGSACNELQKRLFDICMASNIAYPGGVYFSSVLLYIDGKYYGNGNGASQAFYQSFEASVKYRWPPISTLSISKVVHWLDRIPGFKNRIGCTKLGRAIGAFSYLIKRNYKDENELDLMWALLGLEAIYGKSSSGLKSQILEKSEAYLGLKSEYKKKFSWMYDFRSRLIHGDIDIVFNHNDYNATKEYEKFSYELFECEIIATSILIATLQKMCSDDIYCLDFKYVVNDNEPSWLG